MRVKLEEKRKKENVLDSAGKRLSLFLFPVFYLHLSQQSARATFFLCLFVCFWPSVVSRGAVQPEKSLSLRGTKGPNLFIVRE